MQEPCLVSNPVMADITNCEKQQVNTKSTDKPVAEEEAILITTLKPGVSLQDKFKEFKKQRKEKFKNRQYLKNKKISDRSTKEFQDLLRNKFIETAKKYLGIPYAKRHLKPEDAHYNSPLFLDCCGLVRQVVHDLREDFGFTLGRWNQAYQYDVLPIDLKFEELKPGDLIFYSGTYFDPKKKKQRHDMVHVEIFLGGPTGEQSIGARYKNGVVSVFNSYKFVSKAYYDIKFYYKSLDPWLQGVCKNHCNQHIWEIDRTMLCSDKFSVFTEADEDEQQDAEGVDFEEGGQSVGTEETKADNDDQVEKKKKQKIKLQPKKVFVGKGNNENLIRNYFTNEKYMIMDQKMSFSNKYDIRWVQLLNEVDFLSFKEGTQIVNHISNINIIAAKNGLIQTLRDFEANNPNFEGLKMNEFMPLSFRLDILSDEVLFINSPNEGLWITKPYNANKGINLKIVKDIAKFKEDFLNTKRFNIGKYFAAVSPFSEKAPTIALKAEENNENEEQVPKKRSYRVIIQKYIDRPLLLEKKKFDIRCYMLIASTKPLFVLFHHGYCRLCLNDYSLEVNENDELDKLAHITNNSVQKKHPDYANLKEGSIWTMKTFETYLTEKLNVSHDKIQQIYHKIKQILAHTIRCAEFKIDKKIGFFELLGCDILLDENLTPYLIEINSNPAISTNIEGHRETIPQVVNKSLDIVFELDKHKDDLLNFLKDPNTLDLDGFELLFNKETEFIYS